MESVGISIDLTPDELASLKGIALEDRIRLMYFIKGMAAARRVLEQERERKEAS